MTSSVRDDLEHGNARWGEQRLKYLIREVDQRAGASDLPLLAVSLHFGVRRSTDLPRAEELTNYKVCCPGDVVLNRMRAFQGALGLAGEAGLVSPDYAVLRPAGNLSGRFLTYLLRSRWGIAQMASRIRGIGGAAAGNVRTPRVNVDDIGDVRAAVPDRPEQEAIADFLDRESERIDTLLAELDAFETGLSDAERRLIDDLLPSGPRLRLGWLAAVHTGLTLGKNYDAASLVERPYLRVANVQADRIDLDEVKTVRVPASEAENYALVKGDVLMTEGGDMDKLGRGAVWQGEIDPCLHQNHVFAVRARQHHLNSDYLALATRSSVARRYFESTAVRSTNLASTSSSKVRAFRLPTPSLTGQAAILNEYVKRSRPLTRLGRDLDALATSLVEYRDSLITEAVTGRLKVSRLSESRMDESLDRVRLGGRPDVLAS